MPVPNTNAERVLKSERPVTKTSPFELATTPVANSYAFEPVASMYRPHTGSPAPVYFNKIPADTPDARDGRIIDPVVVIPPTALVPFNVIADVEFVCVEMIMFDPSHAMRCPPKLIEHAMLRAHVTAPPLVPPVYFIRINPAPPIVKVD